MESAYHECLAHELELAGLKYESETPIPVNYKGLLIGEAYRLDLLVEDKVIIEIKAISTLSDIHMSQLVTYLRLTGRKLGLLMNFNENVMKNGIRRVVNNL